MLVQVGKGSMAHSRFRCVCGGGGSLGRRRSGALSRCISLFIGFGLGITTTRTTNVSAAQAFQRRLRKCHERLTGSCLASRRTRRTCIHRFCSRVGTGSQTNCMRIVRVFGCLPRAMSGSCLGRARIQVSSVCGILSTTPGASSFTACMRGFSSSGGPF